MNGTGVFIYSVFGVALLIGFAAWLRLLRDRLQATFGLPETPGETVLWSERFVRVGGTRFTYPMRAHAVVTESGLTFGVCVMFYRLPPVFPTQVFLPRADAKMGIGAWDGRPVLEFVDGKNVWWIEAKDVRSMMHAMRG